MDEYYDDYLKEDGELEKSQEASQNLGKSQKIAAASLVILAVLIIGLWIFQLKKSISSPFPYNPSETNENESGTCQGPDCQENNEASLKAKDTDKDGLSDWDELNIYKTSPYLEDSDSDGFTDKEEIESGKDPNCPAGRDCSALDISDEIDNKSEEDNLLEQFNLNIIGNEGELNTSQEEELKSMLEGQGSASALRKMLLEAGMEEEVLNQISDKDLTDSYQEILGSQ